jgi:5-methylcytosine-specific restriction endonuclease McrA
MTDNTFNLTSKRRYREPIPIHVRHAVLARASRQCEICGEAKPLELHHLTYVRQCSGDGPDLIFGHETESDLQALCRECHYSCHMAPWGEFIADIDELNSVSWECW